MESQITEKVEERTYEEVAMKKNKNSNVLRVKDIFNASQNSPQSSLNLQASPLGFPLMFKVSKDIFFRTLSVAFYSLQAPIFEIWPKPINSAIRVVL